MIFPLRSATNKNEQFNDFARWLMFGGDVIAESLRHEQRKVIRYNQLVANMVILHNVQWMFRKLKELQAKRHPIDAEVLQALSPLDPLIRPAMRPVLRCVLLRACRRDSIRALHAA